MTFRSAAAQADNCYIGANPLAKCCAEMMVGTGQRAYFERRRNGGVSNGAKQMAFAADRFFRVCAWFARARPREDSRANDRAYVAYSQLLPEGMSNDKVSELRRHWRGARRAD